MSDENKKDLFEDNTNVDEEDVDIITLRNIEKDKDEDFYHLATYDLNDNWYIALLPVKPEKGEEDDVYIFRVEEQKGDEYVATNVIEISLITGSDREHNVSFIKYKFNIDTKKMTK